MNDVPPGPPTWVKILGAIAVVLMLAVLAVMLLGGGKHGPGRHGAEGVVPPAATSPPLADVLG